MFNYCIFKAENLIMQVPSHVLGSIHILCCLCMYIYICMVTMDTYAPKYAREPSNVKNVHSSQHTSTYHLDV